jgi:hypothetical protein
MHTTHSARYGSRAGLGVTLIQWGFGLRARLDDINGPGLGAEPADAWPTFGSAQEADEWFNANLDRLNATTLASTNDVTSWSNSGEGGAEGPSTFMTSTAASEWLSFFFMTAGWFLLLTSAFGFWRVKRWERGILSSTTSTAPPAGDEETRRQSLFERLGVFRAPSRTGTPRTDEREREPVNSMDEEITREFEVELQSLAVSSDPERSQRVREALERERRLCADLRAAGLL